MLQSLIEIVYILANCGDPDEMPHYVAFHLCLHYLKKCRGFQYTKGVMLRTKITDHLMNTGQHPNLVDRVSVTCALRFSIR